MFTKTAFIIVTSASSIVGMLEYQGVNEGLTLLEHFFFAKNTLRAPLPLKKILDWSSFPGFSSKDMLNLK